MQTFLSIHPTNLLALGLPQGFEWLILLAVALLIFGRRLPEVARSFGKSINEFKKGMTDVTNEIHKEPMDQAPTDAAKLPGGATGDVGAQRTAQGQKASQEPGHLS
ncbi:MAG: twin-arginine translocase TatA/TatE family subunit [Planctomycetes bacterium]|nr:twin-arginine translocase TatA/TatE family subunit [Planctomycetota bacterium]